MFIQVKNELGASLLGKKDTGQILKFSNPHRTGLGRRADYPLGLPDPVQPSLAQAPHCLETEKMVSFLGKRTETQVQDSTLPLISYSPI